MQFFNNEPANLTDSQDIESPTSLLELLAQILDQRNIDVQQAQKNIASLFNNQKDSDKKCFEQILKIMQDKVFQIAMNLPSQFNLNAKFDGKETPKEALTKISDLIFHGMTLFGASNSAKDLLNHIKTLLVINSKIGYCANTRQAFFEDLSILRKTNSHATLPGLKEIYSSMNSLNNEVFQTAWKLGA